VFGKRKFERDLDDELRSFVEMQAAEKVRRGMSSEERYAKHGRNSAAWSK
jgi:hypothetical protein